MKHNFSEESENLENLSVDSFGGGDTSKRSRRVREQGNSSNGHSRTDSKAEVRNWLVSASRHVFFG